MAVLEAQGVKLFWSATTSLSTAIQVGQVVSIAGPSGSAAKIDVTNLDSTGKEYIMGLRDEGDISLDVIYDPSDTGHSAMFIDRGTRSKRYWMIDLSDGSSNYLGGKGFCTGYSITGSVDDAVKATITIAITGAVVQTTR